MDDHKLRAELDRLAKQATEAHESAAVFEVREGKTPGVARLHGSVRGLLLAIAGVGKLFDPPLEVVSEGPRYVVREKKAKDAAAFYEGAKA